MYDLIIVGGGAAGLTAGLYAGRGGLKCLIIEKVFVGGQASTTFEIDNYPGFDEGISGPELMIKMEKHAKRFGVEIINEDVIDIDIEGIIKTVKTAKDAYRTRALILTMGARPKQLGLENERKLRGAGISYCATCDGAFYRDKEVAVVGGGDTAVEDALFLSRFCKKVYLIHRRESLRAVKTLQDAAFNNDKIEFIWNSVVEKINGQDVLNSIIINNVKTKEKTELDISGMFIAVGNEPNTSLVKGKVELNDKEYIVTDDSLQTNIFGVYAAGDIREKGLRQVITAAADGAIAAYSVERYIAENQW
jgi:thioredoxin reductase (NADPH)